MRRLAWPMTILVVFGIGLAVGWGQRGGSSEIPGAADSQALVADLQRRVAHLQQQLVARDAEVETLRQRQQIVPSPESGSLSVTSPSTTRSAPHGQTAERERQLGTEETAAENAAGTDEASAPAEEVALAHFYRFLDETEGVSWQERRRQARALAETLREIGGPAVEALLQALEQSAESRERRAAADLLGSLQDPRALPALEAVLAQEDDLLLRRAAARGLRRLQLPEAVPVLQGLLMNGQEDRFVRMSAAYGLAQMGETQGFTGLAQIFDESKDDGRGRYLAFRSLMSLGDARVLPMMRQLVASDTDVSYRLGAIRFLAEHGDQQALPVLDQVLKSPTEQPSILDAAAQAYATIASGK